MPDVVSKEVRSRMMAGIKGKDTAPEMLIRRELHRRGFRYILHSKTLPGSPDIVFPSRKAAIQINGCFWHGHECHLFKIPSSRRDFWLSKISANKVRDEKNLRDLHTLGWRVLVIWECAIKGRCRLPIEKLSDCAAGWLVSEVGHLEVKGQSDAVGGLS